MANYKGPQYDYVVAPATVVAADIVLDNSVLSFGAPAATALKPICFFKDLIPGKTRIIDGVAETLQVDTITFTAANNTDYFIRISQWDPINRVTRIFPFTYTSLASGDTATTIGDAFRDAINANSLIKVAATGTTTLILTAEAGYPVFTTTTIEPSTTALVHTTPGVVAQGTTAALALEGITVGSGLTYTRVHLEYDLQGNWTNTVRTNQRYIYDILIDEASTDFTNVLAKWNYILAARETSIGGPMNPETLAVV